MNKTYSISGADAGNLHAGVTDINEAYKLFYEACAAHPNDYITISYGGIVRAARNRQGEYL